MSSPANKQFSTLRSYDTNTLSVSAAVTLKVGRPADYFQIDNPINVNVADTYSITVLDGIKANQEIFFFVSARTSAKTVTVATTTGTDLTLDAVGEWAILRWTDSTTGWVKVAGATGT